MHTNLDFLSSIFLHGKECQIQNRYRYRTNWMQGGWEQKYRKTRGHSLTLLFNSPLCSICLFTLRRNMEYNALLLSLPCIPHNYLSFTISDRWVTGEQVCVCVCVYWGWQDIHIVQTQTTADQLWHAYYTTTSLLVVRGIFSLKLSYCCPWNALQHTLLSVVLEIYATYLIHISRQINMTWKNKVQQFYLKIT